MKLFLHNYNVMTSVRCRTGKSIIIYPIMYFYLQKDFRTVNIPAERGEYIRTDQSNTRKNRVYVRTRTAAFNQHVYIIILKQIKVIFPIVEFHFRMEVIASVTSNAGSVAALSKKGSLLCITWA